MPIDIDFSRVQTPNPFAAYEEGRKLRDERSVRAAMTAFGADPESGSQRLIAAGRPDLAEAGLRANRSLEASRARTAANPFLARGDYRAAATAAAPHDIDFSRSLLQLNDEGLERAHKLGTRSASILMAASNLPSPEARRAYIDSHAEDLVGLGMTPDKIAGYDVADPLRMRADAGRFMDLATLAGKVSTEKFGDYAVTYQTDPIRGTRAVSKTEIPITRAEQRQADEFAYRREHDQERLALDRQKERRQAETQADPYSSPSKVMGPIYAKLAAGESLTPGEREALNYYKLDPLTANALADTGDEGDQAEPPRRGAAGASSGRASGLPPRAASQLQEGQPTTFANGQVWTKKNGQPQRLK